MAEQTTPTTHLYFLLDRSGSMQNIADDVVGGFNAFIEAQRREGHPTLLTLVQFDTEDPFELLCEAQPLEEAPTLDRRRFVPRGGTPLYDAMGRALAEARTRELERQSDGFPREEVLFVTFTDGLENSSREYTQQAVWKAIKEREASGWTFVYLGANHDAYAASRALGVDRRSAQSYVADAKGVAAVFYSLNQSTTRLKEKVRSGERFDRKDFFEGDKPAEDDQDGRKGGRH